MTSTPLDLDPDALHARIHAVREARGLTRAALADAGDFWRDSLLKAPVHLELVYRCAAALQVRPHVLLGRSTDAVKPPGPSVAWVSPMALELRLHALELATRGRLLALRRASGLGLKACAAHTGVDHTWITRVERGVVDKIRLELLIRYLVGMGWDARRQLIVPVERTVIGGDRGEQRDHGEADAGDPGGVAAG